MQFLKKLSRHFYKISLLVALCVPSSILVVEPVLAADATCSCYCGDTQNGAVQQSAPQPSMVECTALCNDKGLTPIGCFVGNLALPENDGKCWTKDECAKYATDRDQNPTPGVWGGQSDHCVETKSGLATGYCYSPSIGVNLNIPVLGHTTVMGFHEYLALAYRFLLPAMSLIAVVMIMVGGLEYVVAGGSSKRIDKAKTRITNALIGLVLLMSAYTIVSLLDPRLVNLSVLKMPLMKKAVMLDPGTSCEQLSDYKFDIDPPKGTCGATKGKITGIENVVSEARNSNFKVGDPCDFITCDKAGTACVTPFPGATPRCYSCSQISTSKSNIAASPTLCEQVAARADIGDRNEMNKYACVFDDYVITANECIQFSSGLLSEAIDCNNLNDYIDTMSTLVHTSGDPCDGYEDLMMSFAANLDPTGLIPTAPSAMSITTFTRQAQKVCESDPCGLAQKKGYSGCRFTSKLLRSTCTGIK